MTTYVMIAMIIFLIGGFFLQGWRKIPVPYVGQLTIWGKRIAHKYRKEGWTFLPFFPYWYGIILINTERITFTVTVEKVRTPDLAESKVPVMITFRPNSKMLIQYINSGKEEGVKAQLLGKIQERVREWCMSSEGGPIDWIELNKSHSEGTSILVKKLASNSLVEVPDYAQDVPTWIWLRYFSKPRPQYKNLLKNEKSWGIKEWQKVNGILKNLNNDEKNILEKKVEERRKQIDDLRNGLGTLDVEDLGITIERLNIGDIDVLGEVAKKAEMEAKEEQERKSEALETKYVLERVAEYMKPPYKFSAEQALEAVQTERGKVTKTIQENKLNISTETRLSLEKILSNAGLQVLEMLSKKGGQ